MYDVGCYIAAVNLCKYLCNFAGFMEASQECCESLVFSSHILIFGFWKRGGVTGLRAVSVTKLTIKYW